MGSQTMTAEDVARLARVSRQAVTNWRRRPMTSAGHLPFPAPVGVVGGVERYTADEVITWLEQTGRGLNPDARADAPAFALPEGLDLDAVVTMLTLRSLSDGDLSGLSATELDDLAMAADPDDDFLRAEVAAIGVHAELARYVDELYESALGFADALDRAQASRLGRSGERGLASDVVDLLARVTSACRLHIGGDRAALDPWVDATTARRLAEGFTGVTSLGADSQARAVRRHLALAEVDLIPAGGPTVRVLSVVGEDYPDALQRLDDLVLELSPLDVAVVLGPAALLCDALRGQLEALRAETLSGDPLVLAARLPRGLWKHAHRQQLGLWILAAGHPSGRVVVTDLTSEAIDLDDLGTDVTAALAGGRGRSFRYGRAVERAQLRGRRPLVPPGIRAARLADPVHADHRDRIASATLITSKALAGYDLEVRTGAQAATVVPGSLGELVAAGRTELCRGTRVDASLATPHGSVRVLSADQAKGDLLFDPLAAVQHYPRAGRTEPGDVVFAESPRPLARVDQDGGSLVRYPSRALRLPTGAGIGPHALAAVINLLPDDAGEWRTWNIPLLSARDVEAVESALAAAAIYADELRRRESAMKDLITTLIQGVAAGTVTLEPTPIKKAG